MRLADVSRAPVVLMNGIDHMLPDAHTAAVAEALAERTGRSVTRGLLDDLQGEIDESDRGSFAGELVGGKVANLLPNQAHDSICGCSQDEVHRQMQGRYATATELADQTAGRVLERLAGLGVDLEFVVADVPAFGWRRVHLTPSVAHPETVDDGRRVSVGDLAVEAADDGTLTVARGGSGFAGLGALEDVGDPAEVAAVADRDEVAFRAVPAGDDPILEPGVPLVAVAPASVVLSALKPAEDGDGFVVRLSNPAGSPVDTTVTFGLPVGSVESVRLDEQPDGGAVALDGGVVHITVGPHGLRSIRLRVAGAEG